MPARFLISLFLMLIPLFASAQTLPTVPRYAKFEASWTLPDQIGNPFDPAVNDVRVIFSGPAKKYVSVPAFWDGDCWRVRFAPTQVGRYALVIRRNGRAESPLGLSAARFQCVSSQSAGFVRRDPKTVQRFAFDNGSAYYPLGMDAAWTGREMPNYDGVFARMHMAGMNWARIWMTYWDGKALDWSPDKTKNPKPGEYLLDAARRWDTIMDAADRNDVYVQMTLQHHGQYTARVDPNWRDNPFNTANGGFLAHPDDFFTDARAKQLTRDKYRYILARWGYSTHLLSWELFNEVQNIRETDGHFSDVVQWHQEMASSVRAEDTNRHLVTTSNSVPGDPLAKIGLDYDQIHVYTPDIISFFASLPPSDKPFFIGEWGPSDTRKDMTAAFLHDGLWASLMTPAAGAGQFWYWDQVIPQGWWPQYASVSGYLHQFAVMATSPLETVNVAVQTHGAFGELSFTPPGGWGKVTRKAVTLSRDGRMPNLSGIPSFLQGENHREMMPHPITFFLNCPSPCRFLVDLGRVAKAGAHPVLTLDGKPGVEADLHAVEADQNTNQTLALNLPAGHHQVGLFNTGADWVTIRRLAVTNYAPPVAVLAKGNTHCVFFWAYNRDRTRTSSAVATLVFSGLVPGRYKVRLWDTEQGKERKSVVTEVQQEHVAVVLPGITRDVAGVVTPLP
jgi:hypothetical protein